jgi:peptidoglycan/xylan/chitin deacetylase (PgdA/CDA1 family)
MNRFLKPFSRIVKQLLWMNAGICCRLFEQPLKNGYPILQYHSVSPLEPHQQWYIHPSLSLHPRDFERQMAFVRRRFEPLPLGQLLDRVQEGGYGSKPLIAVTFDDGYRDNFIHALPILRRYRIPATFYLTSECMGGRIPLWTTELRALLLKSSRSEIALSTLQCSYRLDGPASRIEAIRHIKARMLKLPRDQREKAIEEIRRLTAADRRHLAWMKMVMLDWEQVEYMSCCGMEFGAHTMTHPSLPHIPADEALLEIAGSKAAIEAKIGRQIVHFSYPNPGNVPNFNTRIRRILKNCGFVSAATSVPGRFVKGADMLALKRKGIYRPYHQNPAEFFFWVQRESLTPV